MFTIDLANTIFIICVAAGGILLLLTVLLDDVLGGVLGFLHLDFDLGGVTLMPLLLGFVSMFGVGGLFGTELFGLGAGAASLLGVGFGVVGAGVVSVVFSFLRRAEAPPAFSLAELVGQRGRVSVTIAAGRSGSLLLSYGGNTHELTATADIDIPAGTLVIVDDVAGSTLVVSPAAHAASQGGSSHA
ncbi:MAG TPA: NfeD family protein [Candidatus Limnocylindria bacterium]|nr:NfeD family protein [Candidatus Limnocylindria bacterium]